MERKRLIIEGEGANLTQWHSRCWNDHKLLLKLEFHHSHQLRLDAFQKAASAQLRDLNRRLKILEGIINASTPAVHADDASDDALPMDHLF